MTCCIQTKNKYLASPKTRALILEKTKLKERTISSAPLQFTGNV